MAEYNTDKGMQEGVFPQMFNNHYVKTILKLSKDYAVGTWWDGLHIIDMQNQRDKLRFFKGRIVEGLA